MTALLWGTVALAWVTATILALTCLYLHDKIQSMDARAALVQAQLNATDSRLDKMIEDYYDLEQEFHDYVTGADHYFNDGTDRPDEDYPDPFADPDDDEPAPPIQVKDVLASPYVGSV